MEAGAADRTAVVTIVVVAMVVSVVVVRFVAVLMLAKSDDMSLLERGSDQHLSFPIQGKAQHLDPEKGQADALAVRQGDTRRGQRS